MPEQEQTLADPLRSEYEMATLRRWWDTQNVLSDVADERAAQHEQWGDQDRPMGTSKSIWGPLEDHARQNCQRKMAEGTATYADILLEEVYEALAEEDPAKLEDELVQVAAVAVKMVELSRRKRSAGA